MKVLLLCIFSFLFISCKSSSSLLPSGKVRVKKYDFYHSDIPKSFDGFKIGFATDFHYKSKFKEKHLIKLVKTLNSLDLDLLLMGGDYQEGCGYISELIRYLTEVNARFGIKGVLGNNDYERCYEQLISEMSRNNIHLLEHINDTVKINNEYIIISGVRNPFNLDENGVSPTLDLNLYDFVILLTHTPDYAEDVNITNADLVLAGHTHGGQVTILGFYAPVTGSKYGQRFLKGKKETSQGIPIIISKGLGTSRKNIRLFASPDIILLTLRPVS